MEAYLQYRRIGKAVRKQLEQIDLDQEKAFTRGSNAAGEGGILADGEPNDVVPTTTRYSQRTAIGFSLSGIQVRENGDTGKLFIVEWDGEDDPLKPRNYSNAHRIAITLMVSSIAFAVGGASSIDSAIIPQAAAEFGVSEVAEALCVGIFLIGFACGAFFAGPLSEVFGRNVVYILTLVIYMIWIMAAALAPSFGAHLAFRFLAGLFGATPLTCAGGSIADLWNPLEKTWSFPLFAVAGFGGPLMGPVIGSYIGVGTLSTWRWTEWISLIMSALVLAVVVLLMPETYGPLLLEWKAAHLRRATGDARFMAALEVDKPPLWDNLKRAVYRPFAMTAGEPIIMLFTLYMTTLYIVVFTFLVGYPYIFQEVYGISQGLTFVLFVGMMVGVMLASFVVPFIYRMTKTAMVRSEELGESHIRPEMRLWFAMLGAPAIPISLFWMAWTDYASISIWSPITASVLLGYGVISIFISSYMYIIDAYEAYAASGLTFLTVVRYLAAGGMTVVGVPLYRNLGTHWAITLLACISTLMAPIPYVFYRYGHVIRQRSKYAITG